jgi:hypothetical protein
VHQAIFGRCGDAGLPWVHPEVAIAKPAMIAPDQLKAARMTKIKTTKDQHSHTSK